MNTSVKLKLFERNTSPIPRDLSEVRTSSNLDLAMKGHSFKNFKQLQKH